MPRLALLVTCLAAACAFWPGGAAAKGSAPEVIAALTKLDDGIHGKSTLTPVQRSQVSVDVDTIVINSYLGTAAGTVTHADVMRFLLCMNERIQLARLAPRPAAKGLVTQGRRCLRKLTSKLQSAGGAPKPLLDDLAVIDARVREILARARARRVFGAKATALRKLATAFVEEHFDTPGVGGVSVAEAYADLECVAIKALANRASGASSCARRLRRLLEDKLPPPAPITWGSDLSGTPVAIGGTYLEDTETWTKGVSVPVDGTITQFRLKAGAGPVELPLRFTVARPQPDGKLKVITTTDPPYTLPAGKAGTYEFNTSALGFKCCKVAKGDIVTVGNRGNPTDSAYVWFAAVPGATTLLHTGSGQNAGDLWTGTPHDGYEVLLQVVEQPS